MSTETNIFKKCHFGDPNDRISLKNDDFPVESFQLTYFQSKICTNLPQIEFCWKKKRAPRRKFWKKCHFGGRNDGIWPKNDIPLAKSHLLTHFKSKSCTNLSETEFCHKKKTSTETKIFKKCNFRHRNDRIWLKNDDSPGESFPLTYFQSKSSTNLPQTEFWKKCHVGGRNDGIWPKNDQPLTQVLSVDLFPIEKLLQFKWNTILAHKKNEHWNENF